MPTNSPELRVVNSTSYADISGLQLGLERLPEEDTHTFVDRLYKAATARRDHSPQGTINEIALHLGLKVEAGISITSTDPLANISSSFVGVRLVSGSTNVLCPLLDIDKDGMIVWRTLQSVTSFINSLPMFSAQLLVDDGPALRIAKQSNINIVVNELISGIRIIIKHGRIIESSIRFNKEVPPYSVTNSNTILFASEVPNNTTISYQYRTLPYNLVCSDVSLVSLLETGLSTAAVKDGVLAYQIREAIQNIMEKDRSYWAK